ncbi:cobyrinate a,c-diamide synthase [Sphaerisporangium corydalis]|uniref:Hydrogenobyrinate a,c-diamide synthase n=1 Tax=Sphaerisporangium corydalis TaxID=1441875 RepID=A0ABV9EB00_9ACTN|nr:cobyrinate a,c-diamide synthase [Sphaerisporangium corydalis]
MTDLPRLVIAAPSSGSGKTTVATGLMAALTAKGLVVSPHKVGPDYIDPGYHALAAGRPGRNLDPWLVGERLVTPLLLHGAEGAGIAVIEGVMGLYDGAAQGGDLASTAHVARLLDAPVVLVVDVSGQGRSVAALVHGFMSYDTRVRIGGVILNRVGSPRHERICREALDDMGIAVFGAIPRTAGAATPSRHLGLVPPAERRAEAVAAVAELGDLVAGTCDLEGLIRLARTAPRLPGPTWNPHEAVGEPVGTDVVVAVAGGKAFTFGYAEQAELIEAAGATVATFDPLADESLPEGTRAVVLPGGFPEVYAAELSANEPLRRAVAAFGGPIAAECAGLLYLCRELDGRPMCGVLDATAAMTSTLTLGYRDAVAVRDSLLTREGERHHGHEFHRTRVTLTGDADPLYRWRGGADGYGGPSLTASYLHLHWAGEPHLATRLVSHARL